MEWNHILDKQPKIGARIVMVCRSFLNLNDLTFKAHIMNYTDHRNISNVTWDKWIQECEKYNCKPDYWWSYAENFSFLDQPERSKREDLERGCGTLNTTDKAVREVQ